MSKKEKVAVVALDAQSLPRAQALALRLNTAVSCDRSAVSGMVLEVSQDRLALRDTTQPRTRALTIDAAKRRYAPAGKDLLARALGRQCQSIIDATAGFGSDTFDFVRRGKTVVAIERVEVAAIMLEAAASACSVNSSFASSSTVVCDLVTASPTSFRARSTSCGVGGESASGSMPSTVCKMDCKYAFLGCGDAASACALLPSARAFGVEVCPPVGTS